ncbi:restriction endonuclease subunit S [Candidatus Saccharibacteria bacterium]|nr:restriction endonuclease subunit S [Candidatus Saccharibacteria bacterium]
MNKIDELIKENCLDGVKFEPLWSLTTWDKRFNAVDNSKQPKVEKYYYYLANDLKPYISEEGDIKVLTTNISELFANSSDLRPDTIADAEVVAIPWGGNPVVQYFKGKFVTADNRIAVVNDKSKLDTKFLYYVLANKIDEISSFYRGSGIKHPNMTKVLDLSIPVPPLEVQQEIVRMLDSFTELEAELEAELVKRKQQFEYYHNYFFSFADEDIKWMTISQIADTNIGLATSVTKYKTDSGVLLLHNSDIQPNRIVIKNYEYVSDELVSRNLSKVLHKNDIITVHTGDVGTSAIIDDKYDGAIGFTTITTRVRNDSMISPQYLCNYLNSAICKKQIATMTISDRSNLNQSSFDKIKVPVPAMNKQIEINDRLENMDALANDIYCGLPAEIEARHKQYEYYRDKLLTFEEIKR